VKIVIHPQSVSASAKVEQASVAVNPQRVGISAVAEDLNAVIGLPIIRELSGGEIYDGDYSISPTTADQTFQTYGKLMAHDLVVEKIPSNYGLITWNGSVLTVS